MENDEKEKSIRDSEDLSDDPVSDRYSELKKSNTIQEGLDVPQASFAPLPSSLINQPKKSDPGNMQRGNSRQSRTKQRKTQIIGKASTRRGSSSRREGRSGDSHTGSDNSAAIQNALTSTREDSAPDGVENLHLIHKPNLLNVLEDGSPAIGDDNESTDTSALVSKHLVPPVPTVIISNIGESCSDNDQRSQTENTRTSASEFEVNSLLPVVKMRSNYDQRSQTENSKTSASEFEVNLLLPVNADSIQTRNQGEAQPLVEGQEKMLLGESHIQAQTLNPDANENNSDEERSAWDKRQQRELYESDESDDFHPLGVSPLEVNPSLPGPSVPLDWDSDSGLEKSGWEQWGGENIGETSQSGLNLKMDWGSNHNNDLEVPTRNIWREDSTEEMDRKNDGKQEPQISGGFIIDVDTDVNDKKTPEDSNLSSEDQSRLILERAKKDLEDEFWHPFHIPPGKDKNIKDQAAALSEEFARRSTTLKNNTTLSKHEKEKNEQIERWREGPHRTPGNREAESYLSSLNPPNMAPRKRMQSLPLQGNFNKKEFGTLMKGPKRMHEELIPMVENSKRVRLDQEMLGEGWGWNASAAHFGVGEPSSPVERCEKGKGRMVDREDLDENMNYEGV
ncbi:hypothetical protein PGT21_023813 [Puccinia graminis f. sp. tritici]|uniref:Uncharacterized protein n=1 Tax=Puccinia graminis f. sp. tritici TaxID=56615 RepID=A0A5B0MV57_PUCGR|nr:hypothetical protein PGT21_023813 [Puccinia graminis f. sp. tritici]KAA1137011.1 hypothetical protein PGTUg99_003219 [Puccinia graminis f. sp. tritici]